MPRLDNARWERVAQQVAAGQSAVDAYADAGYKRNDSHASRLVGKGNVRDRIVELQGETARQVIAKTAITLENLTVMLLEDRELAHKNGNGGQAGAITERIGKLHGFAFDGSQPLSPPAPTPTGKVIDFKSVQERYSREQES